MSRIIHFCVELVAEIGSATAAAKPSLNNVVCAGFTMLMQAGRDPRASMRVPGPERSAFGPRRRYRERALT